jgi:hypothetical protein
MTLVSEHVTKTSLALDDRERSGKSQARQHRRFQSAASGYAGMDLLNFSANLVVFHRPYRAGG